MSDDNQLPATVPNKPPAPRKKRERKLMTQEEMRVAAQTLGCTEANVMQWTALADVGRGIAQISVRNTGLGATMKSYQAMVEQLESLPALTTGTEEEKSRRAMLRMELATRIGTLASNLMKEADKEPKAPDEPTREKTPSFPIHPPVQVNISTQPSSDVKVISNGSRLGTESEAEQS